MTFPVWLPAQANPQTPVTEAFNLLKYAAVYGRDPDTTTGLTWGYLGGRWTGFSVSDGTLTLTDAATNYIVADRGTGAISVSTTSTNWDNTSAYARVYRLTTAGGLVTVIDDFRAGNGGIFGSSGVTGGVGTIGKQAIYIAAGGVTPSVTRGCAPLATLASAANQPDIQTLDFDPTTEEYAQFSFVMPKKWNEGTITARFHWSHAATTTNFGVVWGLQAVAVSNDDPIEVAFGTGVTATDTGGTTNDLYTSDESGAITVGGTPAAEDMVFFRVYRAAANGSDTMAIDARLHGITLYITTDAETDA